MVVPLGVATDYHRGECCDEARKQSVWNVERAIAWESMTDLPDCFAVSSYIINQDQNWGRGGVMEARVVEEHYAVNSTSTTAPSTLPHPSAMSSIVSVHKPTPPASTSSPDTATSRATSSVESLGWRLTLDVEESQPRKFWAPTKRRFRPILKCVGECSSHVPSL